MSLSEHVHFSVWTGGLRPSSARPEGRPGTARPFQGPQAKLVRLALQVLPVRPALLVLLVLRVPQQRRSAAGVVISTPHRPREL